MNQSSSAEKGLIDEKSSRPHNYENIFHNTSSRFSVRHWIEHNFQKSFRLCKISAKGTKLLFLPHLTATRPSPLRATKLHSADKLTTMHPAHRGNQVQTKCSTTLYICQWLSVRNWLKSDVRKYVRNGVEDDPSKNSTHYYNPKRPKNEQISQILTPQSFRENANETK